MEYFFIVVSILVYIVVESPKKLSSLTCVHSKIKKEKKRRQRERKGRREEKRKERRKADFKSKVNMPNFLIFNYSCDTMMCQADKKGQHKETLKVLSFQFP